MIKFILAQKKEMTQKFTEDGSVIPVTKVTAGPCFVVQRKNAKTDGYSAIQVGFGSAKNLSKPVKGHIKNLGNFQYLKEFRVSEEQLEKLKIGDKITVNTFNPGDIVKVTGQSKGKGFQGVVRRWGFHGSLATHGHKDQLRMPGSIGATGPAHVFKGTRMGGHMGDDQVTVTNLEIVSVEPETNTIFIKGAVPGARNNLLMISGKGEIIIAENEKVSEVKAEAVQDEIPVEDKEESKKEESTVEEVKEEIVEDKEEESK